MRFITTAALSFCFLVSCHQSAPAQSPDKILKNALKAMGGERAVRKITSTRASGRITRLGDDATGSFELQTLQPNFYTFSFDLNGVKTAVGYNGKSGWGRNSKTGLRTLTGVDSRDVQVESNYRNNLWLNYKKEKSKIIYGGKSNINGKSADLVTLTTPKGVTIKMYFDTASGLLIRDEIPAGDSKHTFDYSDFRSVDGTLQPFTILFTRGNEKHEIKLDSVVHNAQLARSAFDFPKLATEALPDIPTLLKELQANQDRLDTVLDNYTYTQEITARELGKDGTLIVKKSETFHISFYKGKRVRRLIAKNGKPLSPEEQAKVDKNIEKQLIGLENKAAKKEARVAATSSDEEPEDEQKRISLAELLRASILINPRYEQFHGRDVIVFDFEPNPDFDFKKVKSILKFFGKTAGVIWIDAQDKQVARLEAVLADNFKVGGLLMANMKKGAAFTIENSRINNEIWLPSQIDLNLSVKVLLVKGISINQISKYSDYRKFSTEVEEPQVEDIKRN